MAFRFRRTLRLFPGVTLNLGKRGLSASVGPPGLKTTIGPTGVRSTVGLTGTGLSYTQHRPWWRRLADGYRVTGQPTADDVEAQRLDWIAQFCEAGEAAGAYYRQTGNAGPLRDALTAAHDAGMADHPVVAPLLDTLRTVLIRHETDAAQAAGHRLTVSPPPADNDGTG